MKNNKKSAGKTDDNKKVNLKEKFFRSVKCLFYYIKMLRHSKNNLDKKFTILLLTNRDSDNTGDQIIEACDISLIHAVMKNLGMKKGEYFISSRAASMVSRSYLSSKNPDLLKSARRAIKNADLVVFGGAPMFNYKYQSFYERTATEIDLCKKFHVPVIFSAVGIEYFDPENPKCQRIVESVNQSVVRQVTTRDDFESLKKIKQNEKLVIAKVSDPAVFSDRVMRLFKVKKKKKDKKKIGLFVLRANGFVDNGYDFPREKAAVFWCDLKKEFENRGYDCEFISNGHFNDEVFLDCLIRDHGAPLKDTIFNINKLDDLVHYLSQYDGIISCRLHPSIISYSMKIPSVGLLWNMKVQGFYDSIGYGDRVVAAENLTAAHVADKLEKAMQEGVHQEKEFMMSVYEYLFMGFQNVLKKKYKKVRGKKAWSYEKLLKNLPPFSGTSENEANAKLERKFRRTFNSFSGKEKTIKKLKEQVRSLEQEKPSE